MPKGEKLFTEELIAKRRQTAIRKMKESQLPSSKMCTKCKITKLSSEFGLRRVKSVLAEIGYREHLKSSCKSCNSFANSKLYWTDKPAASRKYWEYKLKWFYGIDAAIYAEMFSRQNGMCAICRKPHSGKKKMVVDHDHSTKIVRGLLCSSCNVGIGYFGDSIDRLYKAIKYLKSASSQNLLVEPVKLSTAAVRRHNKASQ